MKLSFGIFEGAYILPMGEILDDIVRYMSLALNLTEHDIVSISDTEMANFTAETVIKENVDIILIPYTINGGWDYKYYSFTTTALTGDTVILAKSPIKRIETSFSRLYVFDKTVFFCVFLSLFCISGVSSIIIFLYSKSKKGYGEVFVSQIWSNLWSLFRVVIPVKLERSSYRILLAFWLVLSFVLFTQQNCSFTAQMSFSTFLIIKEFDDMIYYEEAVPKVLKDSIFDKLYTSKMKNQDLISKKRYYSLREFIDPTMYEEIMDGKLIIVANDYYVTAMAPMMLDNPGSRYKFQVSPTQGSILQGLLMSNNLSRSVIEDIDTRVARIFACKTYDYRYIRGLQLVSLNTWKPEDAIVNEPSSLKWRDIYISIKVVILLQALSFLLVFYEMYQYWY